MILRRITEHVSDQNWTAVALDLVIVVLGVFIGIQVSNWNEVRNDRSDEASTLRSLHEEILRADAVTAGILDRRVLYANDLAGATNVLHGLEPDRPLTVGECNALAVSHILYVGRVDLPALSQLQASGRLDILRDKELKNALVGLIQRREALDLAMEFSRTQLNIGHLYPLLFRVQSILEESAARPDLERRMVVECEASEIRGNPRAMNDIALNADGFDAFMRDGLRPWTQQYSLSHRSVDEYLGISHDSEKIR